LSIDDPYASAVKEGKIKDNLAQRAAWVHMQELLIAFKHAKSWTKWRKIKGIYLYGSVGAGKTFLMDLFYQHIDEKRKLRFHFHQFMQEIDAELRYLQGKKDPIYIIAKRLIKKAKIIYLDECLVKDVGHAILIAELLRILFSQRLLLLVTANTAPEHLYWGGVQRDRFLPAIHLIKEHCEVIHLVDTVDHRFEKLPNCQVAFYPLNRINKQLFREQFEQLSPQAEENGTIFIQNRFIPFIRKGERIIWFDFAVLCNLPRSQLDYLELAKKMDIIFLANIPILKYEQKVAIHLFMLFIDIMYDKRIKVFFLSEASLMDIYLDADKHIEYQRTKSRLQEMQAESYFATTRI